jgi:hypothetical protein
MPAGVDISRHFDRPTVAHERLSAAFDSGGIARGGSVMPCEAVERDEIGVLDCPIGIIHYLFG